MHPLSDERIEFLTARNKMLELMLQEIGTNGNRYNAFTRDIKNLTRHQVKVNIEVELLQNTVEINTYRNFIQ